jgi:hypothetical protein
MSATLRCPHCERMLFSVVRENVPVSSGLPPRSKLLAFACPACRTAIGVELVFDVPRMAHAANVARLLPTSSLGERKMSLNTLMNKIGGNADEFIDLKNEVIHSPTDDAAKYCEGFKRHLSDGTG